MSIALGIGANTAIFTLVDEVLLRRLPVKDPEQLVLFNGARNHYGSNSGGNMLSFPMYEDFRDNFRRPWRGGAAPPRVSRPVSNPAPATPVFSGLFARRPIAMNVGVNGQTERVPGEIVSGTYFQVLGVGAAVGRVITPDDDRERGGSPVAVLSYDYWRNRFGADPAHRRPDDHDQQLRADHHRRVAGRLRRRRHRLRPERARAGDDEGADDAELGRHGQPAQPLGERVRPAEARRHDGAGEGGAAAAFTASSSRKCSSPDSAGPRPTRANSFSKARWICCPPRRGGRRSASSSSQPLWLLLGIVAGVLLIACANVASLLIARATARQKEIAVRLALGASRARIVGQLLVESVMLAAIGGLLGLAVASWTTRFLLGFLPTSDTPHVISGAIDNRILVFNFALSLATGLLFGLVPALRSTKGRISRRRSRIRSARSSAAPAACGCARGSSSRR